MLSNMKLNLVGIIVFHDSYYIPEPLNFLPENRNLLVVKIMKRFGIIFRGGCGKVFVGRKSVPVGVDLMVLFGGFSHGTLFILYFSSLRLFLGNIL